MAVHTDQVISIVSDSQLLAEYHYSPDERKPYFHPLYLPPLSEPVTCFRPWDHIWHTGLWFAWKYLNSINFWEEGPQIQEALGSTIAIATSPVATVGTAAVWSQRLEWVTDAGERLLTEERHLKFWRDIPGGAWAIDWTSEFTAVEQVELNRTDPTQPNTPWGGYGGLFMRLSRAFWGKEFFLDSAGRTDRAQIHSQTARWVDQSGRPDGSYDSWQQWAGIAIFDHPQNLRHPTPWYTLPWLVGPAPLYHEPFSLAPGERLSLRYRVLAHLGQGTAERIEAAYRAWLAEPQA